MKILLNALYKSPSLYILRSETSALVTISNIWNSEGGKEYLSEAFCYPFSLCGDMCDLDWCFGSLCHKRFPELLGGELLIPLTGPDDHIIGNGPNVYRNVEMGLSVGQGAHCKEDYMKFGQLCWLLGPVPLIRNTPVKDWKAVLLQLSSKLHHIRWLVMPSIKYINCLLFAQLIPGDYPDSQWVWERGWPSPAPWYLAKDQGWRGLPILQMRYANGLGLALCYSKGASWLCWTFRVLLPQPKAKWAARDGKSQVQCLWQPAFVSRRAQYAAGNCALMASVNFYNYLSSWIMNLEEKSFYASHL